MGSAPFLESSFRAFFALWQTGLNSNLHAWKLNLTPKLRLNLTAMPNSTACFEPMSRVFGKGIQGSGTETTTDNAVLLEFSDESYVFPRRGAGPNGSPAEAYLTHPNPHPNLRCLALSLKGLPQGSLALNPAVKEL